LALRALLTLEYPSAPLQKAGSFYRKHKKTRLSYPRIIVFKQIKKVKKARATSLKRLLACRQKQDFRRQRRKTAQQIRVFKVPVKTCEG
jgi:hypothetical protein